MQNKRDGQLVRWDVAIRFPGNKGRKFSPSFETFFFRFVPSLTFLRRIVVIDFQKRYLLKSELFLSSHRNELERVRKSPPGIFEYYDARRLRAHSVLNYYARMEWKKFEFSNILFEKCWRVDVLDACTLWIGMERVIIKKN